MTTPTSGDITFTNVASTELGQSTPYTMSGMYNTANTGGSSGLMYHNLNMAIGNATTAKNAIWDNYNAGTNEALSNWYNYSQNIGIVVTYTIYNNHPSEAVNVDLTIWDSGNTNVGAIYSGSIPAGGSAGPTTVNTGALSSGLSSGYYIAVQGFTFSNPLPPSPPGPVINRNASISASSASDTDGVGAGTGRNALGFLGNIADTNQSFPPPPPPTTFTAQIAVQATSGTPPTIYVNKRTTFEITVT